MNLFEYKNYGVSYISLAHVIIPASLNPITYGHTTIFDYLRHKRTTFPVFEISISNVDKNVDNLDQRVESVVNLGYPLIVNNAKTFAAKILFYQQYFSADKLNFAVGVDTWNRLFEYKYYQDSYEIMMSSLKNMSKNSYFYILPRNGEKPVVSDVIKHEWCKDFAEVNISSTQIREINGTV